MMRPEMQELERLIFWQGQLLKSRDFRDQASYDARLRAWHNRSLHETRAVVFGFDVSADSTIIRVARGLAYDARGRELWLSADWTTPRPAPGTYLVVVAPNQQSSSGDSCCTSSPGCGCGCGGHGREAEVELVAEALDMPEGLVVARVIVGDTAPVVEPCLRFVRPIAKPRVALGETVRDNTPWEIWSERFITPKGSTLVPVGVQTRVDTSAAGFTTTPNYFATLRSDGWTASARPRPEFLPAYFAHIAKPARDSFLFRLLLKDIARRQFTPRTPEAVVATVGVAAPNRLRLRGAGLEEFTIGDPVALVRPRPARDARASMILAGSGDVIVPAAPVSAGRLVMGNLPRASRVVSSRPDGVSVLTIAPAAGLGRRDVLALFPAGGTPVAARVRKAVDAKLSLDRTVAEAAIGVEYRTGNLSSAATVAGDPAVTPAGTTIVPMSGDLSLFKKNTWVVDIDAPGGSSVPAQIASSSAGNITLRGAQPTLRKNSRLVPLGAAQSIVAAEADTNHLSATVENGALFEEGDVVGVAGRAQLAVVSGVTGNEVHLEPQNGFAAAADTILVAANWQGAVIPYQVISWGAFIVFSASYQFALARFTSLLRIGDVITVWQPKDGSLDTRPDRLTRVAGVATGYFIPAVPLAEMTAGSFVVFGSFPATTQVRDVNTDGSFTVDPAALRAGDWIAPLAAAPAGSFPLAQITAIDSAGKVTLSQSIGVAPGMLLGVVHFRETANVRTVNPDGSLQLTEPMRVRAGDFVASWDHHADNTVVGIVRSIDPGDDGARAISIGPPDQPAAAGVPAVEMQGLPGVVPKGLIDGGILALASLTPTQPAVRIEDGAMPQVGDDLTISGPSPLGLSQSIAAEPEAIQGDRVSLVLRQGAIDYSIRPEQMSILSDFTERFPSDFAVFAHRQELSVNWMAVEKEPRRPDKPEPVAGPCAAAEEEQRCH